MRLIGTLDDAQYAERFSAWLLAEGIENHVEKDSKQYQVWIKNEDQVKQAAKLLEEFVATPGDSKYSEAFARVAKIQRQEVEKRKAYQRNVVKAGSNIRGAGTPLTITLLVICCAVALLTRFGEDYESTWIESLAFTSVGIDEVFDPNRPLTDSLDENWLKLWSVTHGQIWRLVTPIFIHYGTTHLIFNMIWLFQLGRFIERREGTTWMAVLVFVSAAISNLVQVIAPWDGLSLGINGNQQIIAGLGGMSGVVYALFDTCGSNRSLIPIADISCRRLLSF
ncbi:MAG: rhomboid family intramembrane serine protease [Pirellulaceae bacterium]